MRPDVTPAKWPHNHMCSCNIVPEATRGVLYSCISNGVKAKQVLSWILRRTTTVMQQTELLTKCTATCLPFEHLPISPYFPPPRGCWWFERSSVKMMKGKIRNTPTHKYYRHCSFFRKSWHKKNKNMHWKMTVMNNIQTLRIVGHQ